MSRKDLRKRFSLAALLWFSCLSLGGLFVLARPVAAQDGSSSVATGAIISALKTASGACPGLTPCPPKGAAEGLETADDKLLKPALQTALLSVLLNVVQFALDRLAYEAAVAIASGGEGQSELFYSDKPGEAWKKFGLDIAGEAIGQLSDVTDAALDLNFNLCAPPNPVLLLNIQLGIKQAYQPQKPKCDWSDISTNWEGFVTTTLQTATHPSETVMAAFAKGLRPGQNELSAAIGINLQVQNRVLQAKTQGFNQQINSDGFKDLTDVVTGQVKTPSSVLSQQFNNQLQSSKEDGTRFNMEAVINSPQLIGQMFLQVAGVFTNTLLSTLFNRVYNGLFDPQPTPNPLDAELISLGGRDEAASRFSNFISANPVTINDYNAVAEFVTCPSGGVAIRNVNNCVMDANFAAATTRGSSGTAVTVQEAIDEGLLQGNWPLIPATEQDKNQDPFCYTYGYCYGNLVKLRKARILPVGWEVAAARNGGGKATLQEIVNGFDDCNDQGSISPSDSSKWCHLIDPNWILKYPDTQCKAYVNGEILISSIAAGRAGECADTPSCISEDAKGNCTGGYGYCVMEKNVWRFRGDECPTEYAGCLAFANTFDGDQKNLLLNTVDFSVCTAQNAGCAWFRTNKYFDNLGTADPSDDVYAWLPTGETFLTAAHEDDVQTAGSARTSYTYDTNANGVADGSYSTYAYEDRVYFNNNVDVCSASEAGCTKLYDGATTTLNLVGNPSFEGDVDTDSSPDHWSLSRASGYETTGGAYFGTDSLSLSSTGTSEASQEGITLSPGSFYTLSFYAKGNGAGALGTATLRFADEDGFPVDFRGTSFDAGEDCIQSSSDSYEIAFAGATDAWTRYECTFTSLAKPMYGALTFEERGGSVRVDGVQLERGEAATAFADGYSSATPTAAYLKIAPEYLGCDGSSNDPKECDAYAQMCTAQDVGCNLYAPEDGDPSVPAIATSLDQCPNACVGYATYKQEGTLYDDEEFPLYFIADTATSCSAEQVGCDGFTNLDAVANGGESQEYFTSLRACVKESQAGADAATFFTWEGSDASGYQLVTWRFLTSDRTSPVMYRESTGVSDKQPTLAPCANWVSVEGPDGAVTLECRDNDASAVTALNNDDGCNELSDIYENPDCREFYDADGFIHYRRVSETVLVDDACHPYRKTVSSASDCAASKGLWDANAGSCFYQGLSAESASCPATADGCRAYTGGSGRNTTTVLSETFEGGNYESFMHFGNSTVTLSSESVASSGHSLRVTGRGSASGVATLQAFANTSRRTDVCTLDGGCPGASVSGYDGACTVEKGKASCGTLTKQLVPGQTLTVEFWAKGTGTVSGSIADDGGAGTVHALGAVSLGGGWQLYELGPVDTSAADWSTFTPASILRFSAANDVTFYLDNIRVKQTGDTVTLVKDSWKTPAACDTSPSGASAPQYYLGCEAYTDQNGDDGAYYQFSNLCSEKVVGCGAFFDTQNSTSPSGAVYNARCTYDTNANLLDGETVSSNTACQVKGETVCTISTGRSYCLFDATNGLSTPLPSTVVLGPEAVIVENDRPVYVVNNGTGSCSEESMGCEEVGVPTYAQDKATVTGFASAYYLNLPDTYKDILCDNNALFCEEWSSTQDGNFYFKDPGTKACEYKTNVTISNVEYAGWFRTGTDIPCDSTFLEGGASYGIWRNGDAKYDGWAGSCPNSADLCTAFVDPTDTGNGLSPEGTTYTFKDNELLSEDLLQDSQRCNGQVSQKEGCALFDSHNNSELTYAASPSYIVSTRADYFFGDAPLSLQDPIDCDANRGTIDPPGATPSMDVCEMRCKYTLPTGVTLETGDVYQSGTAFYANACATSDDCSTLSGSDAEDYQGSCVNAVAEKGDAARFRNDTNTIIKVNRDRECAAWLEPKTEQPNWDARVSKYVSTTSSLTFCTASGCSLDGQDPVLLDATTYANRDISWGGVDYSGYSIPNQLPVIAYGQANINPSKVCKAVSLLATDPYQRNAFGEYVECLNDTDCGNTAYACKGIEKDLRLAYIAGSCNQPTKGLGAECVVGRCEQSGNACSLNTECNDGEDCVVGYCQLISTTACTSDTQCTGVFSVCDANQGVCVNALTPNTDTCITASDCSGAGMTCTPSALAKTGSCFNDQCLTDIAGQPFKRESDSSNQCRGFPESTSPFPTSVVETWSSLVEDADGTVKPTPITSLLNAQKSSVPQTLKFGFQGVDTCAPSFNKETQTYEISDACSCSYDKADYGNGSAHRYYPRNTSTSDILSGICLGGAKAGKECASDKECGNGDASSAGTCSLLTRKDSIFGWDGFCLEKDTSIQINGSDLPKDRACLTWFPVDQLEGSTDLYGKDIVAGYAQGDTYYCAEVGTAYDLSTTGSVLQGGAYGVACAESYGTGGCDDTGGNPNNMLDSFDRGECAGSVSCPDGYFALMSGCGMYDYNSNGMRGAGACHGPWATDKDCSFVCIPKDAHKTIDDGGGQAEDFCSNPSELFSGDVAKTYGPGQRPIGFEMQDYVNPNTRVYVMWDPMKFAAALEYYNDCTVRGITDSLPDWIRTSPTGTPNVAQLPQEVRGARGFHGLDYNIRTYAACTSVVQVAEATTGNNAAWTNRLWNNPAETPHWNIKDSSPFFRYTVDTMLTAFGRARGLEEKKLDVDSYPQPVVMCIENDGSGIRQMKLPSADGLTCPAGYTVPSNQTDGQEARSYLSIALNKVGGAEASREWCANDNCVCTYDHQVLDCNSSDGVTTPVCNTISHLCEHGPNDGLGCEVPSDCTPYSCLSDYQEIGTGAGGTAVKFRCGKDEIEYGAVPVEEFPSAINRLRQIFARGLSLWTFNDGYADADISAFTSAEASSDMLGAFERADGPSADAWAWDFRDEGDASEKPTPPVVRALGECFGTQCRENLQNGTFSVNGVPGGKIAGSRNLTASVAFFAFADENQMPIKNMIVDWGDGNFMTDSKLWPTTDQSGSTSDDNFYKNHRGLLQGSETQNMCDNTDWGHTPQACTGSYVSFKTDYSCTPYVVDGLSHASIVTATGPKSSRECLDEDGDGYPDFSPCLGTGTVGSAGACVFRPRVHVKDNWGWCTGFCPGGTDDTNGCYGETECNVEDCPGDEDTCFGADPWVYFDGYVEVTPADATP